MKIKSDMWQKSDQWRVTRNQDVFRAPGAFPCHLSPVARRLEKGIALVITLILLSVTLVMAVAFLAISNRERSSVTTTTDATTARLAAETALAQAESQIISTMLATTNPYNYGLLVSTNYINRNGFDPADPIAGPDPLNVNYDDTVSGTALTAAQLQQNIANLYLSPRVPVFIPTNGGTDFRFYLDLNRNGRFDTNGVVTNVDNATPPNGLGTTSQQVGDPEWVGVLERPDTTHGPNNKFLSRYAFIAVPVGNTLDVNYIHNQAFTKSVGNINNDGFLRNQGVGSWEINLAAFLADLNTNEWDNLSSGGLYQYLQPGFANSGAAFNDAFSILSYRYNYNYNTLASANQMYAGGAAFQNDNIDEYSDGSLQTSTTNINEFLNEDNPNSSWVGADNTNHFFTPGEFFNPNETSAAFTNRLMSAGNGNSTYDRYTFYRMLSELGTDSSPESGLMNINYDNIDSGFNGALNANGTASVTNFVRWTAIGFFTNAADRMLRLYTTNWFYASLPTSLNTTTTNSYLATYYGLIYTNQITFDQLGQVSGLVNSPYTGMTNQVPGFGITHIPVLMYGQFVYSPAVNRVLQLAANMYDATTNKTFTLGTNFPSVFRPNFWVTNEFGYENVYINGFSEVTNILEADLPLSTPYDLKNPNDLALLRPGINFVNVFGVPMIIGAKKGFPNFNEFYMENVFQLTRKLIVTRQNTNDTLFSNPTAFNYYEMFNLSLTNSFGVELWNSYTNDYTRLTDIYVTNYLSMGLTNDEGFNAGVPTSIAFSGFLQIPNATNSVWSGYSTNANIHGPSFKIPLATNYAAIPTSIYRFNDPNYPIPYNISTNLALPFETNLPSSLGKYPQPQWGLAMTNNLQVFMVDHNTGRLIDYVQLSGPNTVRDLTGEIRSHDPNGFWDPSRVNANAMPNGLSKQLADSKAYITNLWGGADIKSVYDQLNGLVVFLNGINSMLTYNGYVIDPTTLHKALTTNATQVPINPTATVVQDITWQANDPLVHYIASDLNNPALGNGLSTTISWPYNLGEMNQRYMPWNGNFQTGINTYPYNFAIKDPLVISSDNWDFPSYKFPTVGWLGRVHRGTPWQTVYLKRSQADIGTWTNWTGNINTNDAINTLPTLDHLLFDLFTTAPDDNATRGRLSVNQSAANTNNPVTGLQQPLYDPVAGLASWSALFSGIVVPTSLTNSYTVISPVGPTNLNSTFIPPLLQLVTNINFARAHIANRDGLTNIFEHVGSILTAPQLTEQSPFLVGQNFTNGVNDELMEWLPQQMMSLLRAPSAPRYVIYCYGQALKPAPNSIVTGGTFFQMVTNYQVVTESAARAVIRVDDAKTPHPHIVVESFNLLPPD